MSEIPNISLPKWPAMVVVGKPVTKGQAQDIIMRTDSVWCYMSCNDRAWTEQLCEIAGVTFEDGWADYNDLERVRQEVRMLELEYLMNSRIASSYVGGPHGWCDWNGNIMTDTYNIGKWPSVGSVLAEWSDIAEAFPYLTLKCQLFSGEQCEDATRPLVEYHVSEGKAEALVPDEPLLYPRDTMDIASLLAPGRERGCTIEMFTEAFAEATK